MQYKYEGITIVPQIYITISCEQLHTTTHHAICIFSHRSVSLYLLQLCSHCESIITIIGP